ncbi:hypothetical protein [Kitasatospora sp. NPDC059673]|uniref:hypothetical protein n=1 Tax=Kitasatospora sp. NPDC059673 TaxID=3346901 RepID=UPI003691D83E
MRRIGMLIATTLGVAVLAAGTAASADIPQQPDRAPAAAGPKAGADEAKSCVKADTSPFAVTNNTDGVALVFDEPDCTGHMLGAMLPGETKDLELGQSVYFVQ